MSFLACIMIVEDEPSINELLFRNLTLVGHRCEGFFNGDEAMDRLEKDGVDLMLLDIMLPGKDGLWVLKHRPDKEVPVILVTARTMLFDRVQGLELGADDYIVKPFETIELIARVNAVLRRTKRLERRFSVDETMVDLDARQAYYREELVELTPQEFSLLEALVLNRNLALSRERLLELAWGYDYPGESRTVDAHITKLRKKLGLGERIRTVYKLGYRLEVR